MSSKNASCITYDLSHYMAVQKVEIEEHRWYLGEKLNREITNTEVVYDWMYSGHSKRFRKAYMAHLVEIEQLADRYEGRTIPNSLVHKILED